MKIMLVDDEEISNFIMKKQIQVVAPEAQVAPFTNSPAAYNDIDNIAPDIIFLDLNMPIMDGWDFLEKMKAEGKPYKVCILTSSSSELDKAKSEKYEQVQHYLLKPLNGEKLKAVLAL